MIKVLDPSAWAVSSDGEINCLSSNTGINVFVGSKNELDDFFIKFLFQGCASVTLDFNGRKISLNEKKPQITINKNELAVGVNFLSIVGGGIGSTNQPLFSVLFGSVEKKCFSNDILLGYKLPENDFLFKGNNCIRSERLFVVFTSFGKEGFPLDKFEFYSHFDHDSYDVLFLRDNTRNWYLNGIVGYSKDFEGTLENLSSLVSLYENVTFLGVSMGGYAALKFGLLLNVDRVVAISPQFNITPAFRKSINDSRWKYHLDMLSNRFKEDQLYGICSIGAEVNTSVEIYVSSSDVCDLKHVQLLESPEYQLRGFKIIKIDFNDHYLAGALASSGRLYDIIHSYI